MATAKDNLELRDRLLDEYERNIGIPKYQAPGDDEELEQYLTMDRRTLESLTGESCSTIAYRLLQYSFHIQRSQNREEARIAWATSEIEKTIAGDLHNYDGYSYKERATKAISANSHASKLQEIQIYATQRAKRLEYLSTTLKNLADMLRSVEFNKRKVYQSAD